jgi:hypothetical protein
MASRHDISCDSQTGGRVTAIHPFGIEMRDEYKLVHIGVDMTVRLMEDVAWFKPRSHQTGLTRPGTEGDTLIF